MRVKKDLTKPQTVGRRLLIAGICVLLGGLVLLATADIRVSVYTLFVSVLLNAAGAYLRFFHHKNG